MSKRLVATLVAKVAAPVLTSIRAQINGHASEDTSQFTDENAQGACSRCEVHKLDEVITPYLRIMQAASSDSYE